MGPISMQNQMGFFLLLSLEIGKEKMYFIAAVLNRILNIAIF